MARRVIPLSLLLALSWVVLTFTHEAGHILGGWCSGGILTQADLVPWRLPYSIFEPDPHPLVTLWAGPLLGVLVPCLIAVLIQREWMWFIASFCALANGLYLAVGWFSQDRFLDTPQLFEHGAQPASVVLFCVLTIGFGYWRFRRACISLWRSFQQLQNSDA